MCRLILALLLVGVLGSQARDFVTTDGVLFRSTKVTRVEPMGLMISHEDGLAFLEWKRLPESLKRENGFSEERYAAAIAEVQRKESIEKARLEKIQADRLRSLTQSAVNMVRLALLAVRTSSELSLFVKTLPVAPPTLAARGYESRSLQDRDFTERNYQAQRRSVAPVYSSRQCAGTTKKGYRCRRTTSSGSYCYQHP